MIFAKTYPILHHTLLWCNNRTKLLFIIAHFAISSAVAAVTSLPTLSQELTSTLSVVTESYGEHSPFAAPLEQLAKENLDNFSLREQTELHQLLASLTATVETPLHLNPVFFEILAQSEQLIEKKKKVPEKKTLLKKTLGGLETMLLAGGLSATIGIAFKATLALALLFSTCVAITKIKNLLRAHSHALTVELASLDKEVNTNLIHLVDNTINLVKEDAFFTVAELPDSEKTPESPGTPLCLPKEDQTPHPPMEKKPEKKLTQLFKNWFKKKINRPVKKATESVAKGAKKLLVTKPQKAMESAGRALKNLGKSEEKKRALTLEALEAELTECLHERNKKIAATITDLEAQAAAI